jgi:hypothetical protein
MVLCGLATLTALPAKPSLAIGKIRAVEPGATATAEGIAAWAGATATTNARQYKKTGKRCIWVLEMFC